MNARVIEGSLKGPHYHELLLRGPTMPLARSLASRCLEARRTGWRSGIAEHRIRAMRPSGRERSLTRQLTSGARLGVGEAEALALARFRKLTVVLDDMEARAMVAAIGAPHVGTAGVLLAAFVGEHLSYDQLEEAVRDLGKVLCLAPDVVAEILKRARELKR